MANAGFNYYLLYIFTIGQEMANDPPDSQADDRKSGPFALYKLETKRDQQAGYMQGSQPQHP